MGTDTVIGLWDGTHYAGRGGASDNGNYITSRYTSYGRLLGALEGATGTWSGRRNVGLTDQKECSGIVIKDGETYYQANLAIKF